MKRPVEQSITGAPVFSKKRGHLDLLATSCRTLEPQLLMPRSDWRKIQRRMSYAMQRDGARVRTPSQEARDSRQSRRAARQQASLETDIDSSEDSPQDNMSMNSNNAFPSFLDNNSRGPPSQQVNGNGGPMNGVNLSMPMNAGHQMDVNMLYQKVLELSEVLKENRDRTQGIVAGAEELAVRLATYTRRCLA